MTKERFFDNAIMAVEVEYDMGGRNWSTMKGSEVNKFCDKVASRGDYISDIDFCTKQDDPEIRKILDKAYEIFYEDPSKFGNLEKAIESLLDDDKPAKRIWKEEEIKSLVQSNDAVLYGALKKLYACQTADEQANGHTKEQNGKGFNGVDSQFLSSVSEFLIHKGFLTDKQKYVTRKKLVKYTKQLTRLANA